MRVNCKRGAAHTEEENAGSRLWANTGILDQLVEGLVRVESMKVVEREMVLLGSFNFGLLVFSSHVLDPCWSCGFVVFLFGFKEGISTSKVLFVNLIEDGFDVLAFILG